MKNKAGVAQLVQRKTRSSRLVGRGSNPGSVTSLRLGGYFTLKALVAWPVTRLSLHIHGHLKLDQFKVPDAHLESMDSNFHARRPLSDHYLGHIRWKTTSEFVRRTSEVGQEAGQRLGGG